jgi:hypothetical protein
MANSSGLANYSQSADQYLNSVAGRELEAGSQSQRQRQIIKGITVLINPEN